MIALVKAFIRLVKSFMDEERSERLYNGLYIPDETPRALGTKIRRFRQ